MRRVAVVGSGIAGLAAAWALTRPGADAPAAVTLFEADARFGGHTHTVDVTLAGPHGPVTHGVDTGFLVFNRRTYPNLVRLFETLDIPVAASDMSFSVQAPRPGARPLEWSGRDLDSVFAQRRNLVHPPFWRMLADVLRFNRLATALALGEGDGAASRTSIDDFLRAHRFGDAFRDWYFLPMVGSIWSCPTGEMLRFPAATMARFCHNHGLLQVTDRPQWYTVAGGARRYVERLLATLPDVRAGTPVRSVRQQAGGVLVATDSGSLHFDAVVLACHSDQALALLADPSPEERALLGAIRYQPNRAVLHTDAALLPRRERAWAAWNYECAATDSAARPVCLHYLMNRLQPLPFRQPLLVSLNPVREPAPASVLGEYAYAHPVFDLAAIDAQRRLPDIQGPRGRWYCGAWTGYGFHEDGLASGLAVAQALRDRAALPMGRCAA